MDQSQLVSAPRSVPLSCRLGLLFGGAMNLVGWGFFCFGILFAGIFVPMADTSLVHYMGQTTLVQGVVEESEMTDTYEDEAPVFRIHYSFGLADGSFHGGSSYATGVELDPGTPVTIEYPADNPWISRVEGMRSKPFGLGVLFVLIFPAIGAAIALYGLKNGWKNNRLLSHGQLAKGSLKDKRDTGGSVNGKSVYRLEFEFVAGGGRYRAVAKTTEPERLEDEETEAVLYDPQDPQRSVLVDSVPGSVHMDQTGAWAIGENGAIKAIGALVLPLIAAAEIALFVAAN